VKIMSRVMGIATAALAALLAGPLAASSWGKPLVAPVSAGPAHPTHINHLDLNGFFPTTTQIHVGDSVNFSINGFHTVTFLAPGQAPPPPIVPGVNPVTGQLDAAKLPLWFNGQPQQVINPAIAFPSGEKIYGGSGLLNSGIPTPGAPPVPFVVKFTKTGAFTFNCVVHPGMKGVVSVLPKSRLVPTAGQDRALANLQEAAAIVRARQLRKVKAPVATVLAGNDGNSGPVAWLRFFPQNLRIKAGTTVEFKLRSQREIHTITIGPAAYTTAIEKTFTTPQPNPVGPPTLVVNPLGAYPSDPPPLPPFTGVNHGNGFEGTGILAAGGGPLPSSARITFTKAGTYSYECVVHPTMDGKIIVTK
jgi:plastocyanin